MATSKPRITITLDQDVYDTIRGLAEAQGCTMSGLVSEFLAMVNPVQQRVLEAIKKAQNLDAESKAKMVSSLEASEAQLTQMIGPLLTAMDQFAESLPPHSNTGVTTPYPPTPSSQEIPAKRHSRAVNGQNRTSRAAQGEKTGGNR